MTDPNPKSLLDEATGNRYVALAHYSYLTEIPLESLLARLDGVDSPTIRVGESSGGWMRFIPESLLARWLLQDDPDLLLGWIRDSLDSSFADAGRRR